MRENKYSVDWYKLAVQLLPYSLRHESVTNFIYAFISPLNTVYKAFKNFKQLKEYEVKHNGSVVLLEKLLRDFYDTDNIRITDGEVYDETYITYSNREYEINYQQYIGNGSTREELYIGNDYSQLYSHFVIHMPREYKENEVLYKHGEAGLRKIVDKYKLAGKVYKVIYDM